MFDQKKISLLQLNNPYDFLEESKETMKILNDVTLLRLKAYKKHHPYGVLPLGSHDYISKHFVAYYEDEPLFCFMVTDSITCAKFNLNTPLESVLIDCQINPELIVPENHHYSGWFAINPRYKKGNPELFGTAYRIFLAAVVLNIIEDNIKCLNSFSSNRLKTNKIQNFIGFKLIKDDLKQRNLNWQEVSLYRIEGPDKILPDALANANEFRSLWDHRKIIEKTNMDSKKVA